MSKKTGGNALLKAIAMFAVFGGLALLVRYSPLKELLTSEAITDLLNSAGIWAPILFIALFILSACFFVPATVLTMVGTTLFGGYRGYFYSYLGAVLGAVLVFLFSRYMGREFVASIIGDRMRRYDDTLERNGFATVLYIILLFTPLTPMNLAVALTKVRFGDYLAALMMGYSVTIFVLSFCAHTIKEIVLNGQWQLLLGWKLPFAAVLVCVCLTAARYLKSARHLEDIELDAP